MPEVQQRVYTNSVSDLYRSLADLLLSQGRILESQRVLELLKVEELREFTGTRAQVTADGIAYTSTEQAINNSYNNLVSFGVQVSECERSQCSQLSQLHRQREALVGQYNEDIDSTVATIRQRLATDDAFDDPRGLSQDAKEIVEAQPGTMLVYPLVLEDKLWLIWVGQGGVVDRIEVPVTQQQLGETVVRFRQLLENPTSDLRILQSTSHQLYQWLIQPLQSELDRNQIQHLVFSLDRVTRYIPVAALFDGQHYLIENYTVSTVVSAELTEVRDRLPPGTQNTSVLALGVSEGSAGFDPLPSVPAELDAIVRRDGSDSQGIYSGLEFLNQRFTFPALADNIQGQQIIHIATHGRFEPGSPDASYLLLGNGQRLTIPQVNTLDLNGVGLVVLSACETALGEPGADGIEIAGLGYYFLTVAHANAVMASLWLVSDSSTEMLMRQFYRHLSNETPTTKAEALRQAQLSLLHGESSNISANDSRSPVRVVPRSGTSPTTSPGFSHPYYWAPFILIGNGL